MDYGIVHSKAAKTVVTKISDEKILMERYYSNGQLKVRNDGYVTEQYYSNGQLKVNKTYM